MVSEIKIQCILKPLKIEPKKENELNHVKGK